MFALLTLNGYAAFAQAQNYHSWVSAQGNDGSPCTDTAPCASFVVAVSKTNAGGEVSCLTSGLCGGVTINKSITIDCKGVHAQVTAGPGFPGINIETNQTDTVVLRGLDIDMTPTTNGAYQGIYVESPCTLILDDVKVGHARVSSGALSGLEVVTSSGIARVVISNSLFVNNGGPSGGAGIRIAPRSSGGVGERNFHTHDA